MRLTEHFTLDEMTKSSFAKRHGLDNTPGEDEIANLRRLCETILQPLRDYLGRPIIVSSGYRSLEVNRGVGGSKTSDHMDGRAADFEVHGMTVQSVIRTIIGRNYPFDQLIDEFDGAWCHVSIPRLGQAPRRQFLAAQRDPKRGVVYAPGRLSWS